MSCDIQAYPLFFDEGSNEKSIHLNILKKRRNLSSGTFEVCLVWLRCSESKSIRFCAFAASKQGILGDIPPII